MVLVVVTGVVEEDWVALQNSNLLKCFGCGIFSTNKFHSQRGVT